MSASVGVALSSAAEPTTDAETMLRDADTAMYQAKGAGRDMVTVFDELDARPDRRPPGPRARPAPGPRARRVLPHVPADRHPATRTARWWRASKRSCAGSARPGGSCPASFFIECAEASGLLTEIGDWVIREAARQLAGWRRVPGHRGPLRLGQRLGAAPEVATPWPARVRRALAETGLTPDALCIELAESTLMDNPAEGVALVIRLKELGVRLAVDDFGNGYASLAYLAPVPGRLREDRPQLHRGR